ncbi:hypothetical protein Pla22_33880 [Rubripirellula amarantea]|uniref:Uncharacterized protein n=1 Tax=Rubripirellula amarantea TaxID=2527999 RepID=A0A5C5WKJ8_9BACT|nr:hypothetical protein [Rubripirellula amarantea]TWT50645.1 hypothetical protein Pla22_33880 [Rubripirellula amarantea]
MKSYSIRRISQFFIALALFIGMATSAVANDVLIRIDGQQLTIAGDDDGNFLTFRVNGAGDPFILSLRGTTINGTSTRFNLSDADITSVVMFMRGGNDVVIIRNVSLSSNGSATPVMWYDGGSGNNRFVARGVAGESFFDGSVRLDGGSDNDFIDISDYLVTGDVDIRGELGRDRVDIQASQALGQLSIVTGRGLSFVELDDVVADSLVVTGGRDINRFKFFNVSATTIEILTGISRDLLTMQSISSNSVSVDLDNGRDDALLDSFLVGVFILDCGPDNDFVAATNIQTSMPSSGMPSLLNGSFGTRDTLLIDSASRAFVEIESFEIQD